jgi:hypothetical protein
LRGLLLTPAPLLDPKAISGATASFRNRSLRFIGPKKLDFLVSGILCGSLYSKVSPVNGLMQKQLFLTFSWWA